MGKITRRTVAFCLIFAILMSGCQNKAPEQKAAQAMGRYVESNIALPEALDTLYQFSFEEETTMIVLGWSDSDKLFHRWSSADYGETWAEQNPTWIETLNEIDALYYSPNMGVGSDGIPYIFGRFADEQQGDTSSLSRYEGDDWAEVPLGQLVYEGYVAEGLWPVAKNRYAASYYSTLLLYDGDGTVLSEYESRDRFKEGSFFTTENEIYYTDGDTLICQEFDSSSARREIPMQTGDRSAETEFVHGQAQQNIIAWDENTQSICYANRGGIYTMDREGKLTEKILDGNLTQLSAPALSIQTLHTTKNGDYFVAALNAEDRHVVLRYQFSANVPTVPETTIEIYSLNDTASIRQAVSGFTQKHPEVAVKYSIGRPDGVERISYDDALKALSTRLLAEDGPDLLVLDGLPIESYIEKNVLLGLDEIPGDYFQKILASFDRDGKRYALPTRFQVPLLLCDSDAVAQVQTPEGLFQYLSAQKNPRIGYQRQQSFWELSKYYWPRWISDGGALDHEAFSSDLQAFRKLYEFYGTTDVGENDETDGSWMLNGLIWGERGLALGIYPLFAVNNLSGLYSGLQKREGKVELYPQSHKAFFPVVNVGINAQSQKVEWAKEFLAYLLSEEQQSYMLGDGLPVNRRAMQQNLSSISSGTHFMTYAFNAYNEDTMSREQIITEVYWPDLAFQEKFLAMLADLHTPYIDLNGYRDVCLSAGDEYINGKISLEEALRRVESQFFLMGSE